MFTDSAPSSKVCILMVVFLSFFDTHDRVQVPRNLHSNTLNFWDVDAEEVCMHTCALSFSSRDHTCWCCFVQIARQLTCIEYDLFARIKPTELLNQSWNKPHLQHRSPNVLAMIERYTELQFTRLECRCSELTCRWLQHAMFTLFFLVPRFNTVSLWVTTMIVKVEDLKMRARMLTKCINITKVCWCGRSGGQRDQERGTRARSFFWFWLRFDRVWRNWTISVRWWHLLLDWTTLPFHVCKTQRKNCHQSPKRYALAF
jgi:hypothetical protein